ncbi:MAG: UvrD-helicase domain-containing protein [Gaiellaceae bacterium]
MELTAEQLRAVERRDGPLFLEASAGSGKTRVLVERFVRAVCDDGVPVERILAITFTEKAAAEMKARIRKRFIELDERDRAREAEAAWVSTIHGFCARVLRTHPLAAGVDPEYRVLDETEAARISVDAFDRALEDFLARSSGRERVDLVASYTPDRVARMVRTVYSRQRSQGEREPRLPPIDEPLPGDERGRLERALAAAGAELAPRGGEGKRIDDALGSIERCRDALAALAPDAIGDEATFSDLEVKRGNARVLKTPAFDELAEAHAAWVELCAARKAYADYNLLAKLLERYCRRHAELKEARSALDFEDLELTARDLLRSSAGIREHYRRRFEHVMVDEYQDTNPLQNELLDLIAGDGNLFTVGDERQSIYGFRNADVRVFRERRSKLAEAGRVESLRTNFRTAEPVLDRVNAAFERVWPDGFQRISAGSDHEPRVSPSVELLVVDRVKSRWDAAGLGDHPLGPGVGDVAWRAAEARLLAARVDALAGEGGPYEPGDVAVLLRAASDMNTYERALADRGLPTYAAGSRGYFAQQQVSDLRAYLATLANPLDELALCNLLASPLVGASIDALALIRMHAREQGRGPWRALEDAFRPGGDGSGGLVASLPERDVERVSRFVEWFGPERREAPRLSLETVLDRAVTRSRYDRRILALPGGERRLANVRKLMRLAREYEGERGRDVRGFIDYVDERELLQAREGEAPLEGEGLDAVRLMTIHAAKGLEFPVVCVADLGRHGRGDDGPLQVSPDGRVGLTLASMGGGGSRAALHMEELKEEQEREAEAEERRIFYVAMTRAEEHLIVSGATDTEKWPEERALGSPIDWAWRALAPGLRDAFAGGSGNVAEVDGLRCVLCTPASLDEALPPADRVPPPLADAHEPEPVGEAPPFTRVGESVALPVARLSYSALEAYDRCGYRFYLERVARLRGVEPGLAGDIAAAPPDAAATAASAEISPDGQLALVADEPPLPVAASKLPGGLDPMLRGTVIHQLLEELDFARPVPPSRERVEARLEAQDAAVGDAAVEDITAQVTSFVESELCRRVAAARRVRKELPFVFSLAADGDARRPLLVNGVVDVHAAEDGGVLVVDYKSDPLDGADPVPLVEERYATQRLVYALAALRSGADRAEVAYCFLEMPDRPVTAAFGQDDVPGLERRLLALAAGVVEGRFEPSDRPHRELCHRCPGQPALCRWPLERTLGDPPREISATDVT